MGVLAAASRTTLSTLEAVTRRIARYQAGPNRPARRPSDGSASATSRTSSTAEPIRNSSGNATTSRLICAIPASRVTAAPERSRSQQASAAPSSSSSHGSRPSRDRRAPTGRSVAARLRRPATSASRPTPASSAIPAVSAAWTGADRSSTGLGPSQATSQRASSQPSTVPATAGSASSSAALAASAPGPTPREDSSRTSRARRSAQYDPAAPTSSSASSEPPNAIGSTGPRSPSRIEVVRATNSGICPVPEFRTAKSVDGSSPAARYAAACASATRRPPDSVRSRVSTGDTQVSVLDPS